MQILVLTELLYLKNTEIVHGDSFSVEHVPEEFKEFVGNKKIKANIFKIQSKNSILCSHFFTGFIDFMLAGKIWLICLVFYLLMTLKKMTVWL